MQLFNDLYSYRELLKTNIKKEIRGRYKGSFLGVLWSFINPLLQVLVYAIVFPYIMRNTVDNYLIFLVVGIIPWTFFTTCINQGIASIRANLLNDLMHCSQCNTNIVRIFGLLVLIRIFVWLNQHQ